MPPKGVWLSKTPPPEGGTVFRPDADSDNTRPPEPPGKLWPSTSEEKTTPDIYRCRLVGGTAEGVDCIVLNNGRLSTAILPTRGMGVHSISDNTGAVALIGWRSPVSRPVHPAFVNLEARNGLGWLDGFNELVCRCGLSSNGPPGNDPGARSPIESALTLHGRIANTPAHQVSAVIDEDSQSLAVRGHVDEATLFGPKLRMTSEIASQFHSNSIRIDDVIVNGASTPAELQLLYHINIGAPLLDAGSRILCAADEIAPRDPRAAEGIETHSECLGPTPGYTEQAYYFKPRTNAAGQAVALLRNAAGTKGVCVKFQTAALPYFVAWKCTQPEADGYVTGLEPATNFPNFKAYEREQGRVISLGPGEKYATQVILTVLTTPAEVAAIEAEINAIQGDRPPIIHRTPQPGWSPEGDTK